MQGMQVVCHVEQAVICLASYRDAGRASCESQEATSGSKSGKTEQVAQMVGMVGDPSGRHGCNAETLSPRGQGQQGFWDCFPIGTTEARSLACQKMTLTMGADTVPHRWPPMEPLHGQ